MKALQTVTAVILFLLTITSCRKDVTVTPSLVNPKAGKKFVQVDYMYDNVLDDVSKYTYDNSGRISSCIEPDYSYFFEYQSATKLMVTKKSNSDNSIARTIEATLNEKGFITSIITKDKSGVVLENTSITYDGEGYLVKHSTQAYGGSYGREYVIENGKLISGKKFNNGAQTGSMVYTVDASKENKQHFTAWGYWHSHNLFGKPLKYLPIEEKEFNAAGVLTWHSKDSYERDADGDVTKIITQFVSDGTTGVTTYKY
ncbi:hypothetical protein ESA94_15405 [Lacibacter luteus]|uniref:DUF4595 domain-containing protein n=1 Tax=Lacibacter luteus TaxID=2508719 RepID=A0A4Q1CG91_9BACT|nr:hypothetical protein [Lacibacter luteus]RXK58775.1 hypothetical protein ESA94_15405 [Lacibacter luteus]